MATVWAVAAACAHDDWNARRARRHVMEVRRLGDELAHRHRQELGEANLDDRPLAEEASADRRADHRALADRSVANPARTELVEQPLRPAHRAAKRTDVLTDHKDAVVPSHLGGDSIDDCLDERPPHQSAGPVAK